jgi:hypothetical protein
MRKNMLEEKPCKECTKCYEQERHGFMSMRNSTNKHFGHHINIVDQTKDDGTFDDFKLRYYDIRFSNLCNFTCRSCGGWFSSSSWYQEEVDFLVSETILQFMYAGRQKMTCGIKCKNIFLILSRFILLVANLDHGRALYRT